MGKNVHLVSLGCPKNLVDSQVILGGLALQGYNICEEAGEADLIIVNTCAFVQEAVEEGLETILDLAELKTRGRLPRLVVTGCLPQRYGKKLLTQLPEVDLFLGSDGCRDLTTRLDDPTTRLVITRPSFLMDETTPRLITFPTHTAYVKIADGCDHHCTFCIIPRLRGRHRSRQPESILGEVAQLARSGVKEIILVAQDTTAYGHDLSAGYDIADLLTDLLTIDGPDWYRLMYTNPEGITDKLLTTMASSERICPYLDVPFQHSHPEVLRAMGRGQPEFDALALVRRLRQAIPGVWLRTSLIVGFPTETEEAFNHLYRFVAEAAFNHLGVFTYSPESGARAARLLDSVPDKVKKARRNRIMSRQKNISRTLNQKLVGTCHRVLVEGFSEETDLLLQGRTIFQAPDIDGVVYINSGQTQVGHLVEVKITAAHDYDLVGEIVEP
ncbi:MAG: 30S ribosomal protein S12 methylthiotransferase RimO [Deltaproteobacteria bacterium]|nr:30S ribosomal protein S12 methylthiotransferase RimO [Deltaproteobacteria bacterium]